MARRKCGSAAAALVCLVLAMAAGSSAAQRVLNGKGKWVALGETMCSWVLIAGGWLRRQPPRQRCVTRRRLRPEQRQQLGASSWGGVHFLKHTPCVLLMHLRALADTVSAFEIPEFWLPCGRSTLCEDTKACCAIWVRGAALGWDPSLCCGVPKLALWAFLGLMYDWAPSLRFGLS